MWWFTKTTSVPVTPENLPAGGGLPPKAQHQQPQPVKGTQLVEDLEPTEMVEEYLPPAIAFWGSTMEARLTERQKVPKSTRTLDWDKSSRADTIESRRSSRQRWSPRMREPKVSVHWAEAAMKRQATPQIQGAAAAATKLGASVMNDEKAKKMAWREVNWDNSVRMYVPMHMRGLKSITAEPWSKDHELFSSPWDRIGIGYNDAGDAESYRQYADWRKNGKPVDIQRKLLDESLEYQSRIALKRTIRRFHGGMELEKYG